MNSMYPYRPFNQFVPYGWMSPNNIEEQNNNNGYLKELFQKLVGYRVNILLKGRETVFENLLILDER